MVNATTAAFRKLMLSGHINRRMNEGVQEGIAATKAAKEAQAARCVAPETSSQEPLDRTGAVGRAQGISKSATTQKWRFLKNA